MAWLDGVGASGLDGHDLRELGLKNGNLIVDDRRNGKRWTFDQINVSLMRPQHGGVIFRLESDNPERPWVLSAAMRPLGDGIRAVGIEARKVSTRDILLAMRLNEGGIDADLPLSASIRADILPDGTPQVVQGQLYRERRHHCRSRRSRTRDVDIDHAEFRFNWDARRRSLIVPFQMQSGGNQFTLRATLEAPADQSTAWLLTVMRGDPVIDPVILAAGVARSGRLCAQPGDRARAHRSGAQAHRSRSGRLQPHRHAAVAQYRRRRHRQPGLFRRRAASGLRRRRHPHADVGDEAAVAGVRRAPTCATWVEEHISGGTVERVVIAGNAPLRDFKANGPPTPDDGLSVDIETSGTTVRPIDESAGDPRRRSHRPHHRPHRDHQSRPRHRRSGARAQAQYRQRRIRGARHPSQAGAGARHVPHRRHGAGGRRAAGERRAARHRRHRARSGHQPRHRRRPGHGQSAARKTTCRRTPPTYAITADLTNFAADKMLMGQKVEAQALQVTASNDGYQIKGDVKINGTPAAIDVRKQKGDADAEVRTAGDARRSGARRLGFDFGTSRDRRDPDQAHRPGRRQAKDDRMNVEADLTPVKIDNLLPGWVKPPGKAGARDLYAGQDRQSRRASTI